jgi:uncharacterized membrane protein (UPF0127 family)
MATTLSERVIGLMFKKKLENAEGLLIEPCNSIHTCFMRFSLDIVFISSQNRVVRIIRGMKPWRMTRMYFTAKKTLELPAGTLPLDLKVGDSLEFKDV